MKRFFTTLLLSFIGSFLLAQPTHRIIVEMSDHYDYAALARKTQYMVKEQRRQFVINDKKAFCMASQQEAVDLAKSLNATELRQFWSFNGFSCVVNDEALQLLSQRKDVAAVHPDERRLMVPKNENPRPISAKDNGWHIDKINAPAVWNYNGSTGYDGTGIIVGHIDSGVNYNHADIANSMWDGGEAFPHHGYDVVNNDNDPMDGHGHGTHTAGIIAGQGNSGMRTGVAPGAKIMAIKILTDEGEGSDTDFIAGVEFALEHGAHLLNLSLENAGAGGCYYFRDIFVTSLEAGVAAATAAGNEGTVQYSFPIPYNISAPGNCPPPWLHPDQRNLITGGRSAVICVGATDTNDERCDFSSIGPVTWASGNYLGDYNDYPYENGNASKPGLLRPDLSAPGKSIPSLNYASTNGYVEYDGTSMATPVVAGVMAMLLQAAPNLSPADLDSIIELSADRIGNSKKNNTIGSGRVNALAAIDALFHHGPTNLNGVLDDHEVALSWEAPENVQSYSIYRDGICIANEYTSTSYTDHINYAGRYTYYVIALLQDGYVSLPSNYLNIIKPVEIEAEVINDLRVELSWNLPPGLSDGFESGNLYQNMWINDASYPWEVIHTGANSGTYCVKSTNTGMFTTSKLSLGVSIPTTTTVSYYAKISCFPLNGGGFLIDGVLQGEAIKDEVPWTRYSAPLSPGNHILEWKYANQLAEGDYDNAFYVDDIMIGNPYDIYRANCNMPDTVLIATDIITTEYTDYEWQNLPSGQYRYGVSSDGGLTIDWSECLDKDYDGLKEESSIDILIYPNPTNRLLTIQCADAREASVYTPQGQLLFHAPLIEGKLVMPTAGYAPGMYFIKLSGDGWATTKKFTVIH